jgi:hypothetical protein
MNSVFTVSANDGLRRRKIYIYLSCPGALETMCVSKLIEVVSTSFSTEQDTSGINPVKGRGVLEPITSSKVP